MNETIKKKLSERKIVPVVTLDVPDAALSLGQALVSGGLPIAEITFRTEAAADAIRTMSLAFPEMCIGAGSLITKEQAEAALKSGAAFFVSAGFSPAVADIADANGIPYIPGCCTPTEIITCISRGYDTVKFFPASVYGGVAALRALAAPFPGLCFLPTGGIDTGNIREYLAFDRVIACGSSRIVDPKLIAAGRFDEIVQLVREAVAAVG